MSGVSVWPDTRSEDDPKGGQDAVTERSDGGCGLQVAKATPSSLRAHQMNVSWRWGGFGSPAEFCATARTARPTHSNGGI